MIDMTVLGPKNWGDAIPVAAIAAAIVNATTAGGEGALTDFDTTHATWKHHPKFVTVREGPYVVRVETSDRIYGYVNDGTSAHDIFPHKKRLVFRRGGRPKTQPNGRIGSLQGSKPSGPVIYARKVRHPGTSGRFFNKIIARKWQKQYPLLLRRGINAAIKARR